MLVVLIRATSDVRSRESTATQPCGRKISGFRERPDLGSEGKPHPGRSNAELMRAIVACHPSSKRAADLIDLDVRHDEPISWVTAARAGRAHEGECPLHHLDCSRIVGIGPEDASVIDRVRAVGPEPEEVTASFEQPQSIQDLEGCLRVRREGGE